MLVDGSLRFDEFSDAWRLSAKKLTELDKVREQQARRLVLNWLARPRCRVLSERLARGPDALAPGPVPDHGRVYRRGRLRAR